MGPKESLTEHKAPPPVADINVTPMVDVMLVMLIIFMVITPMIGNGGIPVEMAKARNPIQMRAADKSDAIIVAVSRDAKVFLNTTQVLAEDLPPKVKDLISNRVDKTVFVKSHARARYERVVDVVDNLRAAGVDSVGLLTEQAQDRNRPAETGASARP